MVIEINNTELIQNIIILTYVLGHSNELKNSLEYEYRARVANNLISVEDQEDKNIRQKAVIKIMV